MNREFYNSGNELLFYAAGSSNCIFLFFFQKRDELRDNLQLHIHCTAQHHINSQLHIHCTTQHHINSQLHIHCTTQHHFNLQLHIHCTTHHHINSQLHIHFTTQHHIPQSLVVVEMQHIQFVIKWWLLNAINGTL